MTRPTPIAKGPRRCMASKPDGTQCKCMTRISEEGYCTMHDPRLKAEWTERRRRGGTSAAYRRTRHPPPPPQELEDLLNWTAWCAWATAAGILSPAQASAVGRQLSELRLIRKDLDTTAELERLKAEVAAMKGGPA